MEGITQDVLNDFVATKRQNPSFDDATMLSKFPEFNSDTAILKEAYRYEAEDRSGKYTSLDALNAQFPMFFEKKEEVKEEPYVPSTTFYTQEEIDNMKPSSYQEMMDKLAKSFLATPEGQAAYKEYDTKTKKILQDLDTEFYDSQEFADFYSAFNSANDALATDEEKSAHSETYDAERSKVFQNKYKSVYEQKAKPFVDKYNKLLTGYMNSKYLYSLYDLYRRGIDISESGIDFEKFPITGNEQLDRKRQTLYDEHNKLLETLSPDAYRFYVKGEVWHDQNNMPVEGHKEGDRQYLARKFKNEIDAVENNPITKEFERVNKQWIAEFAKQQHAPIKYKTDAIQEKINALSEENKAILGRSSYTTTINNGVASSSRIMSSDDKRAYTRNDKEIRRLGTVIDLYQDGIKEAEKPYHVVDGNFWSKLKEIGSAIGKSFKDNFFNMDMWLWNIPGMAQYKECIEPILIKNRYGALSKKDRKTYDELTAKDASKLTAEEQSRLKSLSNVVNNTCELDDTEMAVIDALMYKMNVQAMREGTISNAYTGAQTGIESLAFMLEFLVTGGIGEAAAKKATTGYAKRMMKKRFGKEMADQMVEGAGKRHFLRVAAGIDANTAIGSGARIGASFIQAPLMPSTWTGTMRDTSYKLGVDENGKPITLTGDSLGKALMKNYTEVVSESVGSLFDKFPRLITPGVFKSFKGTKFDAWAKIISGANKTLRKGGVNSIPSELAEEIVGNFANYIGAKVSGDAEWENDVKSFWTGDNWQSMLIGFSMLPMVGTIKTGFDYNRAKRNAANASADMRKLLVANGISEEDIQALQEKLDGAEYTADISKAMIEFSKVHDFDINTQDQLNKAVTSMMCNRAAYRSFMDEEFNLDSYATSLNQTLDDFTIRENFRHVMNARINNLTYDDVNARAFTLADGRIVYSQNAVDEDGNEYVYDSKNDSYEYVSPDEIVSKKEFEITEDMRNRIMRAEAQQEGGIQGLMRKYHDAFQKERAYYEWLKEEGVKSNFEKIAKAEVERRKEEKEKAKAAAEEKAKEEQTVAESEQHVEEANEEEQHEEAVEELTPEQMEEQYQKEIIASLPMRGNDYDYKAFSIEQQFIYSMRNESLEQAVADAVDRYKETEKKNSLNPLAKRKALGAYRSLIEKYSPESLQELEKNDNFAEPNLKNEDELLGRNDTLRGDETPVDGQEPNTGTPSGDVRSGKTADEINDGGNVQKRGTRQPEQSLPAEHKGRSVGDPERVDPGVLAEPINVATPSSGLDIPIPRIENEEQEANEYIDKLLVEARIVSPRIKLSRVSPESFFDCISYYKKKSKNIDEKWCVDVKNVKSEDFNYGYDECECYLNEDGSAGFAVHNGDIVSLFNFSNIRGLSNKMIPFAIHKGGVKCDCYGAGLQNLYARFGGVVISGCSFNHEQASDEWKDYGISYADVNGKKAFETKGKNGSGDLVFTDWGVRNMPPIFFVRFPESVEDAIKLYDRNAIANLNNILMFSTKSGYIDAEIARDSFVEKPYSDAIAHSFGVENMVAVWKADGNGSKSLLGVAVKTQNTDEHGEPDYFLITRWKKLSDLVAENEEGLKAEREKLKNQTGKYITLFKKKTGKTSERIAPMPSNEILYAEIRTKYINNEGLESYNASYVPVVLHHKLDNRYMQKESNSVAVVDAVTSRVFTVRVDGLFRMQDGKYESILQQGKRKRAQSYADRFTNPESSLQKTISDPFVGTNSNGVPKYLEGFSLLNLLFDEDLGVVRRSPSVAKEDKRRPILDKHGNPVYKKENNEKIPMRDKKTGKILLDKDGNVKYERRYETIHVPGKIISPFQFFKRAWKEFKPGTSNPENVINVRRKINDRIEEWNEIVRKFNIGDLYSRAISGEFGEYLQEEAKRLAEYNFVPVEGKQEQEGLPITNYTTLQIPLVGSEKESPESQFYEAKRINEGGSASHKAKDGDEYGIERARAIVYFVGEAQKAAGVQYFDFPEELTKEARDAKKAAASNENESNPQEAVEVDPREARIEEINKQIAELEIKADNLAAEEAEKIEAQIDQLNDEKNTIQEELDTESNNVAEEEQEEPEAEAENEEEPVAEEEPIDTAPVTIVEFLANIQELNIDGAMAAANRAGEELINKLGMKDEEGNFLITYREMAIELLNAGLTKEDANKIMCGITRSEDLSSIVNKAATIIGLANIGMNVEPILAEKEVGAPEKKKMRERKRKETPVEEIPAVEELAAEETKDLDPIQIKRLQIQEIAEQMADIKIKFDTFQLSDADFKKEMESLKVDMAAGKITKDEFNNLVDALRLKKNTRVMSKAEYIAKYKELNGKASALQKELDDLVEKKNTEVQLDIRRDFDPTKDVTVTTPSEDREEDIDDRYEYMILKDAVNTDAQAANRVVSLLVSAGVKVSVIGKNEISKYVSSEGLERLEKSDGKLYGFTNSAGEIVLIREELNPNTPIHEYTHLWLNTLKVANPKLAKSIIKTLKRSAEWDTVANSKEYGEHWRSKYGWSEYDVDCKIAGEVLSMLTGFEGSSMSSNGKMKIDELYESASKENKTVYNSIKSAINKFVGWLARVIVGKFSFKSKSIESIAVKSIINMPLESLANSKNPLFNNADTLSDSRLTEYDALVRQARMAAASNVKASVEDVKHMADVLKQQIDNGEKPQLLRAISDEICAALSKEENAILREAIVLSAIYSRRSDSTFVAGTMNENDRSGYIYHSDEANTAMEEAFEEYAKATGIWHENVMQELADEYGEVVDHGTESYVWHDVENAIAIKAHATFQYRTLEDMLESILIGNYEFADAERTLIGFGLRDESHDAFGEYNPVFCVVVAQPWFDYGHNATEKNVADLMAKKGYVKIDDRTYSNGVVRISDLKNDNVKMSSDGETIVIDCVYSMENPFNMMEREDAEDFMIGSDPSTIDEYVDQKAKESSERWNERPRGTDEDIKQLLKDLPRHATNMFDNNLPVKYLIDQINSFRADRGLAPIDTSTKDIYNILNRVAPSVQSKKKLFNDTVAKDMYDAVDKVIESLKSLHTYFDEQLEFGMVYDEFDYVEFYLMAMDNIERETVYGTGRFGEFIDVLGMTPTQYRDLFRSIVPQEDLDNLHESVKRVSDYTLDTLHDADMIDDWKYRELKMRKYYVPQKGNLEFNLDNDTSDDVKAAVFYGHKTGVRATALLHKAEGGDSMADSPLAYLMYDAYNAIQQSQRNAAKKVMWDILLENQDFCKKYGMDEMTPIWYVRDLNALREAKLNVLTLRQELKSLTDSGASESEIDAAKTRLELAQVEYDKLKAGKAVRKTEKPEEELKSDAVTKGKIETLRLALYSAIKENKLEEVQKIRNLIDDLEEQIYVVQGVMDVKSDVEENRKKGSARDNRVQLFVGGVLHEMSFPSYYIADALNGNFNSAGRAHGFYTKLTTAVAAMYTTYNPFFWLSNMQKDVPVIMARGAAEYGIEFEGAFIRELKKSTNIFDYIDGTLDTSTPDGKLLERFVSQGGNTGFNEQKELDALRASVRRAVRGGRRNVLIDNRVVAAFEAINQWSELKTRFAAYSALLSLGYDENEALKAAKNLSVNFNTRGAGTPIFNFFNSISLFSNANIQGALNGLLFFGKKGISVAATIALFGFMNVWLNPDDDDDETSFSDYLRENFILLGKNVKIPIGEELRPFWNLGVQIGLMVYSGKQWKDAAHSVISVAMQGLIPIPTNPKEAAVKFYDMASGRREASVAEAGSALMFLFSPSSLNNIRNIAENKNFLGANLSKEYRDYAQYQLSPKSMQMAKDIARWLYIQGGGDPLIGSIYTKDGAKIDGIHNMNPKQVESYLSLFIASDWLSMINFAWTGVEYAKGEDVHMGLNQIPIIKRNLHAQDKETYRYQTYLDLKKYTSIMKALEDNQRQMALEQQTIDKGSMTDKQKKEAAERIKHLQEVNANLMDSDLYKMQPEIGGVIASYNMNSPIYLMYRTGRLTSDIDKVFSKDEQKKMEENRQDAVIRMRALLYRLEQMEKDK